MRLGLLLETQSLRTLRRLSRVLNGAWEGPFVLLGSRRIHGHDPIAIQVAVPAETLAVPPALCARTKIVPPDVG